MKLKILITSAQEKAVLDKSDGTMLLNNSFFLAKPQSSQAPALRERLPQIFNIQYSIVNSGLAGLGVYNERDRKTAFS